MILTFPVLLLLSMVVTITPVLAIGPSNAIEKNPNLQLEGAVCDMVMGNGDTSSNRWQDNTNNNPYRGRDFTQYRVAVKEDVDGEIKGADVVLTTFGPYPGYTRSFLTVAYLNADFAAQYENKWIYMSSDYVYGWFSSLGMPDAQDFADQWQYGVYYRYVDVK